MNRATILTPHRGLLMLGGALLLVLGAVWGARSWVSHTFFPQTSGTLRLAGLERPVEVRRDVRGVPHLYASTLHDLYFAQGVVHAQDRLWQMDFQRHVGQGRLSEWFGAQTLASDRFARTLGFHRAAQRDWEALGAEARAALEAYSAGINAYVAAAPALPLEYRLLRAGWEPWEALDTLAWARVVQWKQDGSWQKALLRSQLVQQLGAADAALLLGEALLASGAPPDTLSSGTDFPRWETLADPLWGPAPLAVGSAAWAVAGARSETGRPLLVSDLHGGGALLTPWYALGLYAPDVAVVGASLPGLPGVWSGHNAHLAWAVSDLEVDTQTLFVERLNGTGDASEWQGELAPLTMRREVIPVRGGEAVVVEVRETRHGPLLNEVIEGLPQPVALRWRPEPTRLVEALLAVNRARDPATLRAALRLWDAPAIGVLYADPSGAIGYVAAGYRSVSGGKLPVPGWTGEGEEPGAAPVEQAPAVENPPESYLVAPANLAPAAFPGGEAAIRAQRITTRIEAETTLSVDEALAVQRDVLSLPAQTLVPLLVALPSESIIVQRAQEQLASWNFQMAPDLPGAGIYAVTHRFVLREMLEDELGSSLLAAYLAHADALPLLLRLLDDPDHPLWDDGRTPARERRDAILLRALVGATDWLGRRYGDVPHEWFWGRLHAAPLDHPLRAIGPLGRLFDRRVEVGGDGATVNATPFSDPDDFGATSIPSARQAIAVGEWEQSRLLLAGGQSGQPLHPHHADLLGPWLRGEGWPLGWHEGAGAPDGAVLQLMP